MNSPIFKITTIHEPKKVARTATSFLGLMFGLNSDDRYFGCNMSVKRGTSMRKSLRQLMLEPVSKVSSAPVDDKRAATSSNFAKKYSVYLG
ncbi:MAG: hypothetical protein ACK5HO_08920, partial [Pseudomonadota bacterium]